MTEKLNKSTVAKMRKIIEFVIAVQFGHRRHLFIQKHFRDISYHNVLKTMINIEIQSERK